MEIKEGYMPFMGYQTYYRIVGKTEEGKSPIILLHGGPGSTHNYFELLDRVAESGRTVIMYDQLGCGNSFVEGHPELWTPETWLNELCVLIDYLHIDHFHLLGQSWGGMLAIIYLIEKQAKGDKVNVERSMVMNGRLDGHIVQGHVDETAKCIAMKDADGSTYFTFEYELNKEMARKGYFTVDKGSVTVNGVSLTVCDPTDNTFTVAIIPYTRENTNFCDIEVGTVVNIEFDILGKYIARLKSFE
jgi:hypothetical protein